MRTGFFVNLNGRPVSFNANDLSDQVVMANFNLSRNIVSNLHRHEIRNTYKLVHGNSNHVFGNHNGAIDSQYWLQYTYCLTYPDTE